MTATIEEKDTEAPAGGIGRVSRVIGPVVGAVAPGTLVLNVDGCLNCRPEDLAVLMDPGFAPTTDGFSLRLAAAATGPFAASGTYVIS